jgi:hypothetical protein
MRILVHDCKDGRVDFRQSDGLGMETWRNWWIYQVLICVMNVAG